MIPNHLTFVPSISTDIYLNSELREVLFAGRSKLVRRDPNSVRGVFEALRGKV